MATQHIELDSLDCRIIRMALASEVDRAIVHLSDPEARRTMLNPLNVYDAATAKLAVLRKVGLSAETVADKRRRLTAAYRG